MTTDDKHVVVAHSRADLRGQDFHFLPFGSGRRACTGMAHAAMVMHTAIGALVQCFDWKVKGEEKIDIKMVTGYSGVTAHPLLCYPIGRLNPLALMQEN